MRNEQNEFSGVATVKVKPGFEELSNDLLTVTSYHSCRVGRPAYTNRIVTGLWSIAFKYINRFRFGSVGIKI
jgi:hypothetical protein